MKTQAIRRQTALFGTATRTALLSALAVMGESHSRELARILGKSLSSVQAAVTALEVEGAIATRRIGSERRIVLDPRYYAARELKDLLLKMVDVQPDLIAALRSQRRRPRRTGKPL